MFFSKNWPKSKAQKWETGYFCQAQTATYRASMYYSQTTRLRLYRDFKALDPRDPYSIVRYYEQHEEALGWLDQNEFLDCTLAYTNALFEAEEYARHIVMCDFLIEFVMRENVAYFGGEDVFFSQLYKKSLSYYRLDDLPNAKRLLCAVVRIAPAHQPAQAILFDCLQKEMPKRRLHIRAWALLAILISALLSGILGLVVQPFYPAWADATKDGSIALFAFGVLLYLYAEVEHYRRCKRTIVQIQSGQEAAPPN